MSMTQTNQLGIEPGGELGAIDILGALRRRRWSGVLVAFIGVGLSVAAALLWPPTYRSIATILIEEPDVPDDLVKSTVSVFAEERLQLIQQRVMTTQNLNEIIDRFGLYSDELATQPRSQVVDEMRRKIDLEVISTDLIPQKSASFAPPKASIAFTIS